MLFERLRFPKEYVRNAAEPPCALDTILALDANLLPFERTDRHAFPIGCRMQFTGWALLPVLGGYRVPEAVLLRIGDTGKYLQATTIFARDDVARNMGDDRLANAGFQGTQTIDDDVPLGRHDLFLAAVGADRSFVEAGLGRSIEIVESKFAFPDLPKSARVTIGPPALTAMHARAGFDGSTRFERGTILVVRGEAAEPETSMPASRVFAVVDDTRYYGGIAGLPNERGERTNYSVRIPTRHMATGAHRLRIAAVSSDGTSYSLGAPMRFVLRSS